jgi:flagellar biogenesis protein FliO
MREILIICALSAVAAAEPSFEVKDRGDAVEVIAHDFAAARTAIAPVRERLEIPLAGHPASPRLVAKDATVRLVEIANGRLSVKLNLEHDDVVTLARVSQAIQVGPDLHILVPRDVPAAGAAVALPEPTVPPALAPAPVPSKVDVVAPPAPPKVEAVAPPAALERQVGAPKPAPAVAKPAPAKPATLASEPETDWRSLLFALVAGGGTLAGGMWLMKRKKQRDGAVSTIEIVAQRSLGGKARVVWLSAGQRDIIVAVTPQAVRTLGQWRKTDAPAALPSAHVHVPRHDGRPEPILDKPSSPSVAGILRLRQRTEPPPEINEDVATGDVDADALWAKEILMATGARR